MKVTLTCNYWVLFLYTCEELFISWQYYSQFLGRDWGVHQGPRHRPDNFSLWTWGFQTDLSPHEMRRHHFLLVLNQHSLYKAVKQSRKLPVIENVCHKLAYVQQKKTDIVWLTSKRYFPVLSLIWLYYWSSRLKGSLILGPTHFSITKSCMWFHGNLYWEIIHGNPICILGILSRFCISLKEIGNSSSQLYIAMSSGNQSNQWFKNWCACAST